VSRTRVTIGLVVYNGERHLAAAVESFLQQTYRDFELVIYDNASTDATPTIAAELAARDERVRVQRRERNIGALGNLIDAGERADTEYFCWAAHDDVREPRFLEELVALLDAHPSAGLACCAVRNMLPDGSDAGVRTETASLRTTVGLSTATRLTMYLRDGAGTPFYGLFRTASMRRSLDVLRRDGVLDGVPLLALDMMFLADIVRQGDLAVTHEPLLRFRFGGWSHRLDVYGTLKRYALHILGLMRGLRRATSTPELGVVDRARVRLARGRFLTHYFLSPPMRRMSWHYLSNAFPILRKLEGWWATRWSPAFNALARRGRALPDGSTVALFGAGKHTKRRLATIRRALGRVPVVAIADDAAAGGAVAPIDGIPVIAPRELDSMRPTVLLVSSDTFELSMARRAHACAPMGTAVWTLYDKTLERDSKASTSAKKSASSSSVSVPV
jgi:glycosyltransferase involved in cell wall biosynthesis